MSRKKFWAYLRDETGSPIPSASITFKLDDTGALATLYSTSVSGANDEINQSTLTTDVSGFFEFFVGDVYEQGTNRVGYDPDQQFRLEWESADGRKAGFIDDMLLFYQVFPVDETDSINTKKNKLASNDLTYSWETHRQQTWFHEIHQITKLNEANSTDSTFSHVVSNDKMNELKGELEALQVSGSDPNAITISASAAIVRSQDIPSVSWVDNTSASGLFYFDFGHSFNTLYPLIQLWCTNLKCMQQPAKIEFTSVNSTRIYVPANQVDGKHVIGISEVGATIQQKNPDIPLNTLSSEIEVQSVTPYVEESGSVPLNLQSLESTMYSLSVSAVSGAPLPAIPAGAFAFDIQTDTPSASFSLPTRSDGTYNMFVQWGDGETDLITTYDDSAITHTYPSTGTYTVSLSGDVVGWSFTSDDSADAEKIVELKQWGNKRLGILNNNEAAGAFKGCSNMVITATDTPNVSADTRLQYMFQNCSSITDIPNIETWDISNCVYFKYMFDSCTNLDINVNNWDTSSGYEFLGMFQWCSTFNSPVSGWADNLHGTTFVDMEKVFYNCSSFEGKGTELWDMSDVIDVKYLFSGCTPFNRPIGNWGTNFTPSYISSMLKDCSSFNQPLSGWSAMTPVLMDGVFYGCSKFNQNINNWDLSAIGGGSAGLAGMFYQCTDFDQPLDNWDTSGAERMNNMFGYCTSFNQDLSSWDTSSVQYIYGMFYGATSFNQSLATFDMSTVTLAGDMLDNCGIDTTNYDALLNGWDGQSLNSGVTLGVQGLTYTATTARNTIIGKGWVFDGDSAA